MGDNATEETNNSTSVNCGGHFNIYIPTAWYLTRIENIAGKWIDFYYFKSLPDQIITSFSESYNKLSYQEGSTACSQTCSPQSRSFCVGSSNIELVFLKDIVASNGDNIHLSYTNCDFSQNTPCSHFVTCESIIINNTLSSQNKIARLEYYSTPVNQAYNNSDAVEVENRNFLKSVVFKTTSTEDKIYDYRLEYYNLNNIPPRFSFAQDHWGYFNGANNTTSLPTPEDPALQAIFVDATANRNANDAYAINGSLSKITYPTGGYSAFEYEANTVMTNDNPYTERKKGGLRIKKVSKVDGVSPLASVSRYLYGRMDGLTKSSGNTIFEPKYISSSRVINYCTIPERDVYCGYMFCHYNNLLPGPNLVRVAA